MSDYCTDTVPVLLRRSTFCRAFAADAKDFRSYNSWVRALITPSTCTSAPGCAWGLPWAANFPARHSRLGPTEAC